MPTPPALALTLTETTFLSGFGEWTIAGTGRTAKRCWLMQCSRQPLYTDMATVEAALPVAINDPYMTGDDGRFCQKITIKAQPGDLTSLYAEAEYGPNQFEQNPLLRKDSVSLEVGGETESWFVDRDGNPAVTSANEVFDKVPPRTTGGVKLVIEGNRSTLPVAAMIAQTRPSNVNTGAITVRGIAIAAGQAKLVACSGSEQSENGVTFYKVRWELALAPSWDLKLDDRGFVELIEGDQYDIVKGEPPGPVKKPWPLDGSGAAMPDASGTPAVRTFKPYPQSAFSYGWTAAA